MNTISVECVLREKAIVGESPVWCPAEKVLYWVDITGQMIRRFHPASLHRSTRPRHRRAAQAELFAGGDEGIGWLVMRESLAMIISEIPLAGSAYRTIIVGRIM